jgi:hypothetical protein
MSVTDETHIGIRTVADQLFSPIARGLQNGPVGDDAGAEGALRRGVTPHSRRAAKAMLSLTAAGLMASAAGASEPAWRIWTGR